MMKFRSRRLVMPADLNHRETLFGGQVLKWIDEEAAIYVTCKLETPLVVTKFISEIDFRNPAYSGDIIEFGFMAVAVGKTSITLSCEVRNKTTKLSIVAIEKMVFVRVDRFGARKEHEKTMDDM